jgi:hypothetical protein
MVMIVWNAVDRSDEILFQSDTRQFGRGPMHLSAILQEGDIVAYQTGMWLVDHVLVSSSRQDTSPQIEFCCIDTMQVVWTHNCEHGVLRGEEMIPVENTDHLVNIIHESDAAATTSAGSGLLPILQSTGRMVEFGPEQLTARIPVEWIRRIDPDMDTMNHTQTTYCRPFLASSLLFNDTDQWIVL